MKKIFKSIPVLLLALTTSCSKLDINMNPVNPVAAPSNLRLPAIIGNMGYHAYAHARFSAYHSFYLTSRYNTSKIESQWNYNDITRMGAWRWHYFDVGGNCIGMIESAEKEGSKNYAGVGKIMLAFSYLTATDSFGDMPFKEAFSGSFNPVYDPQSEVYAGIAQLLEEGIADLNQADPSRDLKMDATSDLLYGGDVNKWKALAKAVRARMYLHTANFDNGYDGLLATVNEALNEGFTDAIFKFPANPTRDWDRNLWSVAPIPNPQWNFAEIVNMNDNSMNTDFFMNFMTFDAATKNFDPRLLKLTSPGKNDKYLLAKASEGLSTLGLPTGTTMDDFARVYGGYWTSANSPYPLFLKEELYFIKAEAAFYVPGRLAEAYQAYKDGIETNMKRLGITQGEINTYMTSSKVVQSSAALKISDIMMQKYVAMYLQPETWVDMRRYGYSATAYPGIYYPKNALAEWQGQWIQRFPYDPQTEYIYNPKEIERLGAAARNWAFQPVWWAQQSQLKN